MNKILLYKIFYIVSIVLAAAFCIFVAIDAYKYSATINSAPFRVFVYARAIVFLVPSAIAFVAGRLLQKKNK